MADDPLNAFLRAVLGYTLPCTLQSLGQTWPTSEAVDLVCAQIEARWMAEEAAGAQEQLRRIEAIERGEVGE